MNPDFFKRLGDPKSWNRSSILFFAGILGVFFLLAGGFSPQKDEKEAPSDPAALGVSGREYEIQLEQKLTELLSSIQGAGKIQVAVSLESGEQTIYALDEKNQGQTNAYETQHVLVKAQEGERPLVEMIWEPEIRGVAVVCEGAEQVQVCAQITEAISVLTGVSSNRISIAKMSQTEGTK